MPACFELVLVPIFASNCWAAGAARCGCKIKSPRDLNFTVLLRTPLLGGAPRTYRAHQLEVHCDTGRVAHVDHLMHLRASPLLPEQNPHRCFKHHLQCRTTTGSTFAVLACGAAHACICMPCISSTKLLQVFFQDFGYEWSCMCVQHCVSIPYLVQSYSGPHLFCDSPIAVRQLLATLHTKDRPALCRTQVRRAGNVLLESARVVVVACVWLGCSCCSHSQHGSAEQPGLRPA